MSSSHQSWQGPYLTWIFFSLETYLPGNNSGILCERHRLFQKDAGVKDLLTSGTISLVKSPLELAIIMQHCLNPHGFPLLYVSSYLSQPLHLHAATLIRFQRTLLSEIQLKCTEKSAFQKELINSHIWLLLEKRGSHSDREQMWFSPKAANSLSALTGFIRTLCGRRLLFLQDTQNMEPRYLSTCNTCSGRRCFPRQWLYTPPQSSINNVLK